MSINKTKGTIEYSGRAFHQDAMAAMKGDIVRGIIELITNSDDAYAQLTNSSGQNKIIIEVEHRRGQPWKVLVKDRATGMDAVTLVNSITKLGGRTSGFEKGLERRGNLGRGAKDCAAFGDVIFRTIKDNRYSCLILRMDGKWELKENRKAKDKDRKDLGIPRGSGTVVEISVSENNRCPRHESLKKRLTNHFQLRDILSDPKRRVELVKLNDGTRDSLIYDFPDIPIVFEGKLELEGYANANIHLTISRLNQRCEDGSHNADRPNGILIKGGKAIYENTLFGYENNVYSGWFAGRLECNYIDQLAREYDDLQDKEQEHPSENPMPLISRTREGINSDHPFYIALKEAVERPLGDLIEKEAASAAEKKGQIENEQTRKDFNRLAREVGRLINEELRNIEAEELIGGFDGEPPKLSIIPEIAYAYMGENRTLTVAARKTEANVGDKVVISLDPEGVIELLTSEIKFDEHRRREDMLVCQLKFRPILQDESTLITASVGDLTANALVEIRASREIIEEEIELPADFMFERPSYQVGLQKSKKIHLLAPAAIIAKEGSMVKISSDNMGIVVRTPSVELLYDDSVEFYRVPVNVEGRTLDATGEIRAVLGNTNATAQVKVTRKEEGPGFRIQFEPVDFGSYRGVLEKEVKENGSIINVIKIAARHPALRPIIGENFERQNSPLCRILVAEIVAEVSTRLIVEEYYRLRRVTEEFDAARVYREHFKRVQRFLPRFQKLLLGNINLIATSDTLEPVSIISA